MLSFSASPGSNRPHTRHSYLNGNVEAMGKVLRRFNETSEDVQRLRRQVSQQLDEATTR